VSDHVAIDRLRLWRRDAVQFVRDVFQAEPDAWQAECLEAWASDARVVRIAAQACAGPGKSTAMAWCGWHALLTRSDGVNHPNGAAVAITGDNLKNNLWKELAKWYERAPLLQRVFDFNSEKISAREAPMTWFLSARSFAKTADTEAQGRTLSGLHADSIFYLADETGDMPPPVLRAAEQGVGGCQWGRIFQSGNPTSQVGALYQAATAQAHLWTLVRVTGDPDDPRRSPRIDEAWAREQIALYGRENAWVMAFILGQFPPGGLNTLLTPDEVRDAMARHYTDEDYKWAELRYGIDPARFGDDRTVIFPRQGVVALQPVELRGKRGPEIAARAMVLQRQMGRGLVIIDSTGGWGQSAEDALNQGGDAPLAVQFHTPALDKRYLNRRAEGWWDMAEWVKSRGALPNLPGLVEELTTVTYSYKGGQLLLEPKDLVKKRLGRSPDLADALALTFMLPDGARNPNLPFGFQPEHQHATTDWNPFESAA
jgi:phage terminase large subunit